MATNSTHEIDRLARRNTVRLFQNVPNLTLRVISNQEISHINLKNMEARCSVFMEKLLHVAKYTEGKLVGIDVSDNYTGEIYVSTQKMDERGEIAITGYNNKVVATTFGYPLVNDSKILTAGSIIAQFFEMAHIHDEKLDAKKSFDMRETFENDIRDLLLPDYITQALLDAGICNTNILQNIYKLYRNNGNIWVELIPNLDVDSTLHMVDTLAAYYGLDDFTSDEMIADEAMRIGALDAQTTDEFEQAMHGLSKLEETEDEILHSEYNRDDIVRIITLRLAKIN